MRDVIGEGEPRYVHLRPGEALPADAVSRPYRALVITRSPSRSTIAASVTGVVVRGPYVTTRYGTSQLVHEYDLTGGVSDVEGEIWFEAVRR